MTRREEAILVRIWHAWSSGKPEVNQTLVDFYFDVIRVHPKLGHISAFEVLDSVTNAPPMESLEQSA